MARTGLIQDERFQSHDTGPHHPERPARLRAVANALRRDGVDRRCTPLPATPVDMNFVLRVHDDAYIERLRKACADGKPYIDVPDSAICPASFEIARVAVGSVVNAVDAVMDQSVDNAFCAVRPPGHHAERGVSLGFCLLNNVAIAAAHLIEDHGMSRVVILDWDVHHGNGTQEIFWSDPSVVYASTHQMPLFPGTGAPTETGVGNIFNAPLSPGDGSRAFREAFGERLMPALRDFAPDLVLISAGFDAHSRDPLGQINLEADDFAWATRQVMDVADRTAQGRVVSVLEGGYDLRGLADSAAAHIRQLMTA